MRVVLATGNPGKLRELQALLADSDVDIVAQSDLGIDVAQETGSTFVENALIKARHAASNSGLPAIADDSGLEVDALGGRPGVHSARYAGHEAGDEANRAKLLAELDDVAGPMRSARFRCVLVLVRSATDLAPLICEGVWEGCVADSPAGKNGFGYDPLFLPNGLGLTAAQLSPEIKNQLSHRGQALRKLVAAIKRGAVGSEVGSEEDQQPAEPTLTVVQLECPHGSVARSSSLRLRSSPVVRAQVPVL